MGKRTNNSKKAANAENIVFGLIIFKIRKKAVIVMEDKELLEKCKKFSELFRPLGHPVRLAIVKGLTENECNVSRMVDCLGIRQSTVSQHLAVLRAASIIQGRRQQSEVCYKVISEDAKKLVKCLFG